MCSITQVWTIASALYQSQKSFSDDCVQIENWDGTEGVWQHVRTICETEFGDVSFNSFVKMLTSKRKQVVEKVISRFLLGGRCLIDFIARLGWKENLAA